MEMGISPDEMGVAQEKRDGIDMPENKMDMAQAGT